MKKLITVILIIALTLTAALTLTGCAKTGECEMCGQHEKLTKFVRRSSPDQETMWVCEYCYQWCKLLYS